MQQDHPDRNKEVPENRVDARTTDLAKICASLKFALLLQWPYIWSSPWCDVSGRVKYPGASVCQKTTLWLFERNGQIVPGNLYWSSALGDFAQGISVARSICATSSGGI